MNTNTNATEPRNGRRGVWSAWIAAAFASGLAWIVIFIGGFLVLGDHIAETPRVRFDERISLALHDHASPGLTRAMRLATDLGSAYVTVPLILAAVVWLARHSRRRSAMVVTVSWIGAQLLDVALKQFYRRDRPSLFPAFAHAGGYSFPSGHTVTATVTYGLIAALAARELRGRSRLLPAIVAAIIVIAVGTSRVYLGVHYPSDVLGGVLAGGAWVWTTLHFLWRADTATGGALSPTDAGPTPTTTSTSTSARPVRR